MSATFPLLYQEILERIDATNPVAYSSTRNYIDGAVTYLSPYISRGIISTRFVLSKILEKGYKPAQIEKFIQELAWRDYWQQVWIAKGNSINTALKKEQSPITNYAIPNAIIEAKTGITAIDTAIHDFYKTGYLHNHLRMYIAAITCNVAQSHWKLPAQWMYYYLLDADWASNALSWQWTAGANSNKKYYANQDNINKFCHTSQKNTFLDVAYENFNTFAVPEILKNTTALVLKTPLPQKQTITIHPELPTYIYNFYNLDPLWDIDVKANRILLIEPAIFQQYPISKKSMDFMCTISEKNIENIQIYVGAFEDLIKVYDCKHIIYKEHPLNTHYQGTEISRDWMFDVKGYYPSFFAFWKRCKKQLKY